MKVSPEGILAVAYRKMSGAMVIDGESGGCGFAVAGRRMRRRTQSDATESLLRDLLMVRLGATSSRLTPSKNHDGKPTLLSPDGPSSMRVSLSHCGPFALAAITDLGEIGVDLEVRNPRRSISEIAAYAFGPREQQTVQFDGLRAFYRIWTLREAFAKARGLGFPILVDGRDYFAEAPDSGIWQSTIDGDQWMFSTGDLPGDYAVSVAIALQSRINSNRQRDLTPRELS